MAGSPVASAAASCKDLYSLVRSFQQYPEQIETLSTEVKTLHETLTEFSTIVSSTSRYDRRLELPLRQCRDACDRLRAIVQKCTKHSRPDQPSERLRSPRDWVNFKKYEPEVANLQARLVSHRLTLLTAVQLCQLQAQVQIAADSAATKTALDRLVRTVDKCTAAVDAWRLAPLPLHSRAKTAHAVAGIKADAVHCLSLVAELLRSAETKCHELNIVSSSDGASGASAAAQKSIEACESICLQLRSLKAGLELEVDDLDSDAEQGVDGNASSSIRSPVDDANCATNTLEFLGETQKQIYFFRNITSGARADQMLAVFGERAEMRAFDVTVGDESRQILGQWTPEAMGHFARGGPCSGMRPQNFEDEADSQVRRVPGGVGERSKGVYYSSNYGQGHSLPP